MNKPIQTESRKKKHGDRRQHGNGAQDELQEILSQRTNLDMGDGTVMTTAATLEEARQRPDISAEALMRGEEVVTRQPVLVEEANNQAPTEVKAGDSWTLSGTVSVTPADPLSSITNVTIAKPPYVLGDGYVAPAVGTAVGPGVLPQVSTPVPRDIGYLNPLEVTGATPPFISTIGSPIAQTHQQPEEDAAKVEDDRPMYYQENLIIAITRHRAKDDSVDQSVMRCMFSAFLDRISGLKTGFKVIPALGSNPAKLAKPQFEATASTVKLDYTERKGKFLAKFFEGWGLDIAKFGLSDNTTIDFFVIEPSKDGKTVLDAWNCTGMHPYHMSSIEADSTYQNQQLRQVSQFEITLNGNVRRGPVEVEAAQTLLDDLNQQLAAGA